MRCHNLLVVHIILMLSLAVACMIFYKLKKNILFGVFTALFFFAFGSMLTNIRWNRLEHTWQKENMAYNGIIDGDALDKGGYIQFVAKVDGNKVLVRVVEDSVIQTFCNGDIVGFYGKIKRPMNIGNPNEMDYATYLLHNDINGSIFLRDRDIKVISTKSDKSYKDKALDARHKVIAEFRSWGMGGDELALLSALIVGERNLFSHEIEDDYTKSGLSHMLSVSGMHVGILLIIINTLLWFMKSSVILRLVKWITIVAVLWVFAYISGLPPSAVRAVVMCILLELMYFSHEKRNPLNIIFVTAFCMLIYNPFYLFNIGFQLSFAAVITIIIFYSPILSMLRCRYSFVNSISSVVALSISAQIGAAPLVLYYFSSFSSYFLVSNILSSFLVLVITALAFIALVLPFSFLHTLLLFALKVQNHISSAVASLPMSVLKIENFSIINILFIYIIFIILLMYIFNKRRKYVVAMCAISFSFISFNCVNNIPSQIRPHAMVYSDSKMPFVHFIESRNESFVVSPVPDTLKLHPRPSVKQYCMRNGISMPELADECQCHNLYACNGIVTCHGKRFCIVCDKRWKRKYTNQEPLDIDYLYLNRGFYDSIASLQKIFNIKQVIIGFSLSDLLTETIIKECTDKGISFVNLKQRGYYKIML